MIRIVVADDHTIVREGLKQLLTVAGDLEVVAEAQNGFEVMDRVRALDFDVLLLDMSMPGKSGIELIKQVHAEKPRLREADTAGGRVPGAHMEKDRRPAPRYNRVRVVVDHCQVPVRAGRLGHVLAGRAEGRRRTAGHVPEAVVEA